MRKKLISIFLTVFIISLIIMTGPAKAVNVDLNTDKTNYNKGDNIIFTASVDIQDSERIPAKELRLSLNDVNVCTLGINGNIISGCDNMLIEVLNNAANYGYGYSYGTGFGIENNNFVNKTTDFGYGYGYGYAAGIEQELIYKITWDSSNASLGDYNARFSVFASNDNSFEYLTEDTSDFQIIQTEVNNIKEDIYAIDGNLIIINNSDNFDSFGRTTFNSQFRQRNLKEGGIGIGGYGTLNIDAYKNDSTHINLQVKFDPQAVNTLNNVKTDLSGKAKVNYQRNKKGIKVGNSWVGAEPTVRFNGDVSNARVIMENGMLSISSDDPLFTFNVEDMTVTNLDYAEYTYEFSFKNGKIIRKTNINRVRIPP